MWLQKIFNFIKSKTFILIMLFIALVVMSLSFWFWGPLIAFNEVYIFGSGYLRFGIILIVWVIIFFSFLMKPIINFFASLKSKKRLKLKEFKKEANEFINIVKRFKTLQDDDVIEAYDLMKKSLVLYDRFSFIKSDLAKNFERGNPTKKRLQEITDILLNIHVTTRQIYQNIKAERLVKRD